MPGTCTNVQYKLDFNTIILLLHALSGLFQNADDSREMSPFATVKTFNPQIIEKMKRDTFFQVDYYGELSVLEH